LVADHIFRLRPFCHTSNICYSDGTNAYMSVCAYI
jgi:hypothetical protein